MARTKKVFLCASPVPNSTGSLKTYTLVHTQCERVLHATILFLDGIGRGTKQETGILPVLDCYSRFALRYLRGRTD